MSLSVIGSIWHDFIGQYFFTFSVILLIGKMILLQKFVENTSPNSLNICQQFYSLGKVHAGRSKPIIVSTIYVKKVNNFIRYGMFLKFWKKASFHTTALIHVLT